MLAKRALLDSRECYDRIRCAQVASSCLSNARRSQKTKMNRPKSSNDFSCLSLTRNHRNHRLKDNCLLRLLFFCSCHFAVDANDALISARCSRCTEIVNHALSRGALAHRARYVVRNGSESVLIAFSIKMDDDHKISNKKFHQIADFLQ